MTKKLGWNDKLKVLKRASSKDYSTWMAVGMPRHGLLYGSMLKSRKQFKTKLKSWKKEEKKIFAQYLSRDVNMDHHDHFWGRLKREIRPNSGGIYKNWSSLF